MPDLLVLSTNKEKAAYSLGKEDFESLMCFCEIIVDETDELQARLRNSSAKFIKKQRLFLCFVEAY